MSIIAVLEGAVNGCLGLVVVQKVPEWLRSVMLYFAIIPHLSKTDLDGTAFYLGKHPVVALTLRYDRIDPLALEDFVRKHQPRFSRKVIKGFA